MKRSWITFFSQTGSEIANLCMYFNTQPDCIVTNKQDLSDIDYFMNEIIKKGCKLIQTDIKPDENVYHDILSQYENPIVTLHGYLRIIPKSVCEKYEIYNLHPGLITEHPELKGKDPQIRAFNADHDVVGCVLHRVSPEVDEGEIIASFPLENPRTNFQHFNARLKSAAILLWRDLLKNYVN